MNGMSSKEIARHLGVSKRMVDAHFDKARGHVSVSGWRTEVRWSAVCQSGPRAGCDPRAGPVA